MRDIVLFCIIFGLLPFVLKKPFVGVVLFTWVSLLNPHRFTYGAAYDFPFAAVIVGFTLVGMLISKDKKQFPLNTVTVVLLAFYFWMCLTTVFALEPERAFIEWIRVSKTMLLTLIVMLCIRTKKEIQLFTWIVALSIGFFGLKGGLFTILTGGKNHVLGPEGSYIQDNNALALAMVVGLPMIWYLWTITRRGPLRIAILALVLLTALSVVGSYSRGAMLAGAVMVLFLFLKSKYKLGVTIALLIAVPVILQIMPDQWFERMNSIENYASDRSALGRINAWHFAINLANANPFGGGFDCFTHRLFFVYAPEPYNHHAAHSIYFQVLGEHGYIGLLLFLAFIAAAWMLGRRVIRRCKSDPELEWAGNLAAMCQVSIVGYVIGGAFLTLAYYDLFYDIVAILVVLEKYLRQFDVRRVLAGDPAGTTQSRQEYAMHQPGGFEAP